MHRGDFGCPGAREHFFYIASLDFRIGSRLKAIAVQPRWLFLCAAQRLETSPTRASLEPGQRLTGSSCNGKGRVAGSGSSSGSVGWPGRRKKGGSQACIIG